MSESDDGEFGTEGEREHEHGGDVTVPRVAFIRTSDRSTFRRCRRKWNWSYSQRGNREGIHRSAPLWTGTGFHYALEDFHGPRLFDRAADAFRAYYNAYLRLSRQHGQARQPAEASEQVDLATNMLDYYQDYFLAYREPLKTYEFEGRKQTEVRFEIEIPLEPDLLDQFNLDRVVYTGTIDRVAIDEYERLWIVEYKTAKQFQDLHYDTDGQITAYMWAAQYIFPLPVAGVVYQQHKKQILHPPQFLKTRGMFSVNKQQCTTHALYRDALVKCYGDPMRAPQPNIQFMYYLMEQESKDRDFLVKRVYVPRNEHQLLMEEQKILAEAREMLNPKLEIYPNPTRDCSWDCDFWQACVNLDDGGDWEHEIESRTADRTEESDRWREHLLLPQSKMEQQQQPHQGPDLWDQFLQGSPQVGVRELKQEYNLLNLPNRLLLPQLRRARATRLRNR